MKELIGKTKNIVTFTEENGRFFGEMTVNDVYAKYEIKEPHYRRPAEAVLMDLDGTTLTSEEFWIYTLELTTQAIMGNKNFAYEEADIPFVSGYTTFDHLKYTFDKYCPDKSVEEGAKIYHKVAETELEKIRRGEGNVNAFKPTEGLKEFLLALKAKNIKIGLVTSGLDYKCIPEIMSVFKQLDMGDPLRFYDAIITGGRRKDAGDYGTIGEIAAKPHPWIYSEIAYAGLGVKDRSRVLGIEDSSAGVMALRFAGFATVGLNSGNITESGLDCLCHAKVDKLSEILELV